MALANGHAEFSSGRQQDVCEYLSHVMDSLSRLERSAKGTAMGGEDLSGHFKFGTERRLQCVSSGAVKYTQENAGQLFLSLPVPMEATTNVAAVAEYNAQVAADKEQGIKSEAAPVVPNIPFDAVLSRFLATSSIADWESPVTGTRGIANSTTRLTNFPPYLFVHLQRYI
jgi:ubiquitin carboxyl-terminal hydrolase 5/13